MREYKRYDEYKDSRVEWIGEIPKEWEVSKLKYNYTFEKGTNAGDYTKTYIAENKGDYPVYSGQTENNGVMGEINHYDYDLEECILTTTVGAKAMTSKFIKGKFSLSQNCLIMIKLSENIVSKFDYYYLTRLFAFERNNIPSHMQPSLRMEDLNKYKILSPSKQEQQKIASFLDQKTAEIDKIINKKERLIDYLEKYKKSVITEAVTKGKLGDKYINEDGELVDEIEMNDCGVEWVDKIPEYCEPIRLKYLLDKIEYGLSESSSGDGKYKILTMGNISDGKIIIPKQGSLDNIDENYLLENKDLLFNRTNSMEQIAKVGIFRGHKKDNVTFASYLVRLVPNKNNNNEFINYMLNNYKFVDYAKSYAIPSINQANLNPTRYTNLFIIRFPLGVQQSLVEKLNLKTKQIEEIIQKTKKSIEKYKEYKKSLIFEAVTGKIDLRDYKLEGGEELAEHNNSRETERECLSAVD